MVQLCEINLPMGAVVVLLDEMVKVIVVLDGMGVEMGATVALLGVVDEMKMGVDTMVLGATAASTVGTGCAKQQCLGRNLQNGKQSSTPRSR